MLIVGLLSTKQEVEDIQYIAKVFDVEDRIHFVCRMQKLKEMLKNEKKN